MNIGFDLTSLIYQRGVSRYTANLIRSLAALPSVQVSYFGSSWGQNKLLKKLIDQTLPEPLDENIQSYPVSLVNWLWRFGLNSLKKSLPNIDVFHAWEWQMPPDINIPIVVTIHDLAMLHFKDTANTQTLNAHQQTWKRLQSSNIHVIAVSRATRNDVINLLQIPPFRVHLVHEALPQELYQLTKNMTEQELLQIKNQLHLTNKPFLLFVGTREPRKNLSRLIQAWQPLAKDVDLVIVGESGWGETELSPQPVKPIYLGRINDRELSALYTEAAVFVYPSLYEGFGLPILEAFHHWCPVVTSNSSAMVEVAGNAAELIEPESVDSIRHGIVKLLNETPDEQATRSQRMVIRLQMFDWFSTATKTLAVYQTCIDGFNNKNYV